MVTPNWISRRSLWTFLLTAALACSSARFGRSSDDDDPVDAGAADGPAPLTINNPALLRIKKGISFVPQRSHLNEVLAWKIEEIDLVCHLTNGEKEKLRLAGKGDVTRFLDRAHELKAALPSVNGPPQVDDAVHEWDSLKELMTSGIFEEGSLFSKTRRRILTTEQMAKLETETADTSAGWMKDFQEAQALALTLDRPVLMHFHAKWCGPSRKLERVMESPVVLRVLRRKFVLVSIDVDQNPALVRKYNVDRIPCELAVTTAGDMLCRSEGLKGELEFLHALHFVTNEPQE